MEEIKEGLIKELKNQYIRRGIIKDIKTFATETPEYTFLGSTDRKGYTVKIIGRYLDKEYLAFVNIEPFFSEEKTKELIEVETERAKNQFATKIFEEMFNN